VSAASLALVVGLALLPGAAAAGQAAPSPASAAGAAAADPQSAGEEEPAAEPSPWSPEGAPEAPAPTAPLPFPEAPREPGAVSERLEVPAVPPEPARRPLDIGVPLPSVDPRFFTERARSDVLARGALDLDTALVDVPGLWLSHRQAGSTRALLRGLDDSDLAVTLDGAPLFDLGGLLPPLELFPVASFSRLTLHHGARAVTPARGGAAGVLAIDSLDEHRHQGETMRLMGALGGGYGGADLEKGVFTFVETGFRRLRTGLHATLLNREDQRLGRGLTNAPGLAPGGVLLGSSGSGGAVGARLDVMPMDGQRLFTTWHSARTVEAALPPGCAALDSRGRNVDCTRTLERGLDAWIVGGDQAIDIVGARLVVRGRAHAQHGLDRQERSGSGVPFVETHIDEGVRAGASLRLEAVLPGIAMGDVWRPRAVLGGDLYGDRISSRFFSRSTRAIDAEPPGLGIEDATRARLDESAGRGFSALSLSLLAEGARTTLWAAGQLAGLSGGAPAGDGTVPTGELGVRLRLLEDLSAFAAVVHRRGDDSIEAGVRFSQAWLDIDAVFWGAGRTLEGQGPDDVDGGGGEEGARARTAFGAEGRAVVKTGVDGLVGTLAVGFVGIDDGGIFERRAPASGVPNPAGTLVVAWDPSALPAGFFLRARTLLPQQRLSPAEERDRLPGGADPAPLCPERPSDEDLAAGRVQQQPCRGAPGAFLFDLGAYLELGSLRVDAVAENLLDQQGALRDEPIGFGGTAVRALATWSF
jgi:hypothetical protein